MCNQVSMFRVICVCCVQSFSLFALINMCNECSKKRGHHNVGSIAFAICMASEDFEQKKRVQTECSEEEHSVAMWVVT